MQAGLEADVKSLREVSTMFNQIVMFDLLLGITAVLILLLVSLLLIMYNNPYGKLTSTGKGKERVDKTDTVRTCYQCGKTVKHGKILGDPLFGMLLFCNDCYDKDKKEHPDRYEK